MWGGRGGREKDEGEHLNLQMICLFKHTFSQTNFTDCGKHQSCHLKKGRAFHWPYCEHMVPGDGFTLLGEKHQELKVKESNQKPQGCNKVTNKATGSWRLGYELCSLVGVGYQSRRSVDECFHGCRWGARASCWPDSLSCSHMTGNRSDCVTGVFSHRDVATNVFTARNSLQCATWMQRVW